MKKYLEAAVLTKTQGLKGELRAKHFCDSPDVLERFSRLYLENGKTEVKPEYVSPRKGFTVIKLAGIDTVEQAQALVGETLYADREDFDLPENAWFIQDVVGLDVIDADSGRVYGKVADVTQSGAADVYAVRAADGKLLLFPSVPEVLIDVDTDGKKILIRPLDGLFEQ